MDNIKHQKHAKLIRRNNDNFAPNEIAILGSNCSNIAEFCSKNEQKTLKKTSKIAYLDASHSDDYSSNQS